MNIAKLKDQRAQLAAAMPALREQVEVAKANLAHHGGAIQALDAVITQAEAEAQAADIPHTETVEPVTPAARKPRKPRADKTTPAVVAPQE